MRRSLSLAVACLALCLLAQAEEKMYNAEDGVAEAVEPMLSDLVATNVSTFGTSPNLHDGKVWRVMRDHGWKMVPISQAKVVWVRNFKKYAEQYFPEYSIRWRYQTVNQLRDQYWLVNKVYLLSALREWDRMIDVSGSSQLRVWDMHPKTYRMDLMTDCTEFFNQLPAKEEESTDVVWLRKPGHLSRGKGISFHWQFDDLRDDYLDKNELANGVYKCAPRPSRKGRWLMQSYVRPPMLVDGRKSEVRAYWLVAWTDPVMVLVYPRGLLRINSNPFVWDSFDNPLVHITNVYQQKHNKHLAGEETTKDHTQLKQPWDYLEAQLVREKRVQPGWLDDYLLPALMERLQFVCNATLPRVKHEKGHYALYGADFILTQDMRVYLTEIQKNPGKSVDDPFKKVFVPKLLKETMNIVLEIQHRASNGLPMDELDSRQKYLWLRNDASGFVYHAPNGGITAKPPTVEE